MMNKIHSAILILAASLFIAAAPCNAENFLKITDLSYSQWLKKEPSSLIGEFERSCQAVATYLKEQNKDFPQDKCVSGLFISTVFIKNANDYTDALFKAGSKEFSVRAEILAKYDKIISDVIEKAIAAGHDKTRKENIDLIYTLIYTIRQDMVTDYYHNIFSDEKDAKTSLLLAGTEDGQRMLHRGIYEEIYKKLDLNRPEQME